MLHHSWGALHQPFMLKCGCIEGRIWGWSAWAHFQVDLGFVKGGFINQTFFCMSISSFVNIKYLVLILCRVLYMRPLSWGHRTCLNNWTTLIWTELCKTSTLNRVSYIITTKLSLQAYQSWVQRNGEEKRLPAVNLTNDQLFFVGFAQVRQTIRAQLPPQHNSVPQGSILRPLLFLFMTCVLMLYADIMVICVPAATEFIKIINTIFLSICV